MLNNDLHVLHGKGCHRSEDTCVHILRRHLVVEEDHKLLLHFTTKTNIALVRPDGMVSFRLACRATFLSAPRKPDQSENLDVLNTMLRRPFLTCCSASADVDAPSPQQLPSLIFERRESVATLMRAVQ